MPISCVYCGGVHDSPAEVRACWARHDGAAGDPEPLTDDTHDAPAATAPPPTPPTPPTPPRPPGGAASRWGSAGPVHAGPEALGRFVVIAAGAPVPDAWADAPVVVLDHDTWVHPQAVVAELREHHAERRRVVVELHVELPDDDPHQAPWRGHAVEHTVPHDLGAGTGAPPARFELVHDHLVHLVWCNSVDGRGTELRWWLLDRAVALGATPTAEGEAGDVLLADGTAAWIDGGPITVAPHDGLVDGLPVLHRVALEHGSLVPLGPNELHDSAEQLAPDQRAAVLHRGGAARIIAPAGSGKTRVLTERARHLVTRWRVPPSAVTLVAFNRRAQQEMLERTRDVPGLQVRTLNALALAVVNGTAPFARRARQYRTIDEGDVRRILGGMVKTPRRRNSDPLAPWIEALGLVRLGLNSPTEVEGFYDGEVDGFATVYPRYVAALEKDRLLDFDHQVHTAIQILLAEPSVRDVAQRACRLLLVDEFQDLTPAHLLLVRLLAGADGAVFGVGDDDQTIYGYNGADPAWLIDFHQLFPFAGEHPLEVNYRCPGDVVEAADCLLRHNVRRVPKVIRAAHPDRRGLHVAAPGDPVDATVAVVRGAIANARPAADVAVLARVNSLLAPVQAALVGHGIPVHGGVGREFVDRTAVRSMLAWIRLGMGLWSSTELSEALRRPSRTLHPNVASWVAEQHDLDALRRLADRLTNDRDAQRVREFADDITQVRDLVEAGGTTVEVVALVRDSIGLGSAVQTLDAHRKGMNRAAQNDDLTAFGQLAALHPPVAGFERWLRDTFDRPDDPDGVVLATVHRVKGQEWPVVVVHQADADQFPHRLATDEEEERRLFHVAITRTSDNVTVVSGADPSPFIAELTTEPEPPSASRAAVVRPPTRPGGPAQKQAPQTGARPGDGLSPRAKRAFELLKLLRRELAGSKPAYTVFKDATLEQIAMAMPRTLAELGRIPGIGPSKLENYGAAVLAVIDDVIAGE